MHILDIMVYGGFIFMVIYALTDLMDGNRRNWIFELLKLILVVVIALQFGSWFGHRGLEYGILGYCLFALLMSLYFSRQKKEEVSANPVSS